MGLNIVTNREIINKLRMSRYYRQNLGLVPTIEKNGGRTYNDKDNFAFFYNNTYKTTIYGQGNVGDIKFYIDMYINEPVLAVYYGDNFQEFIFDYDDEIMRQKGPDAYLGKLLKECDERYEELRKKNELKKIENQQKGDPNKVFTNPGQVTYEDLKAYLEVERSKRQL